MHNLGMYIVAIGWLFVILMMAITASSVIGGIFTFLFYGLFPVALIMWLGGSRARRQKRAADEQAAAGSLPARRE